MDNRHLLNLRPDENKQSAINNQQPAAGSEQSADRVEAVDLVHPEHDSTSASGFSPPASSAAWHAEHGSIDVIPTAPPVALSSVEGSSPETTPSSSGASPGTLAIPDQILTDRLSDPQDDKAGLRTPYNAALGGVGATPAPRVGFVPQVEEPALPPVPPPPLNTSVVSGRGGRLPISLGWIVFLVFIFGTLAGYGAVKSRVLGEQMKANLEALETQIQTEVREITRTVTNVRETVTTLESVIPIPGPAGEKGETGLQGIAGTAGTAGASGDPCSACVFLQGTTPGSAQSGNFNISGTGILGALGVGIQPSLGALQFAASTTASGGIVFGADTNLYRSSNNVLRTDDEFHIRTNSNTGLYVQNATGTSNLFIADTSNTRIGIGAIPASSLLTVGTNTTTASGGITFGTDVNLYRSDTNRLRTDDNFTVAGTVNLQPANPLSTAIGAITPGDSYYRWYVEAEGKTWWGDGTNAPDTNLYRSGANTLKTEGNFLIRTGTNSTTALQVQSQAGASLFTADTTGMNVTLNGANNGTVSSWTTSSNTLPAVRAWNTGLTANGYIYSVGGDGLPWGAGNGTSSIYYAKANSNGTIGAWSTSPNSLPNPRYNHTAVISNGYMYVMGGSGSSGTTRDVYYAKLNADGSTGVWTSSPNLLPVGATSATAVAYNGYIYHISGSGPGTAVYYTKVNADGSINAWTTSANPLTAARTEAASVVANGHMYVFGGFNSTYQTTVYYSKINADGSHGAWSASGTGLPVADGRFSTVTANGYVYLIGGQPEATTVRYAPFNSDGSTGSWTNTTSIPATRAFGGATVVNGYIYFMGGESGSSYFNTVYHASTSRIKVGGSLDLVGLGGQNLAEGGSGGSLTAGNTFISGNLQATDQVNFWNGLSVDRELTVGGSALFKTATNSTTAFQIQNAAGTNIFVIDSNAMTITLGSASVTPVLLVLGNKNTAGDPTCTAGALYYNSSATQLRGCAGSSWTSLGENKPAVRVYHNTTQSIPHNTNTTLAFNSERFDTDAMHDTATNNSRLTAKTAGVYIITGTVELDANATGVRTVVISHNGVTPIAIQTVPGIGSNTAQISISAIYNFAVNDFVTLQVYQTSGVALNATGTANYGSEFSMTRIAD